MKTFKDYVVNKARPEGCIAERYIQEETLTYFTEYKTGSNVDLSQKLERVFDGSNLFQLNMFDDNDNNVIVPNSGPIGFSPKFVIEGVEFEQACRWVVKSHPLYESWRRYVVH